MGCGEIGGEVRCCGETGGLSNRPKVSSSGALLRHISDGFERKMKRVQC